MFSKAPQESENSHQFTVNKNKLTQPSQTEANKSFKAFKIRSER